MFKFFRRYNKFILAIGAALLMVAFLVQGTVDRLFGANPTRQVIGHIDGRKVRQGDQNQAGIQMQVLRSLGIMVPPVSPWQWLLMKNEAQALALSASQAEVDQTLTAFGIDEVTLLRLADQGQVSDQYVRQAIHDWVMIEHYRDLMLSRTYRSLEEKLAWYTRALEQMRQGLPLFYVQTMLDLARGSGRYSRPLIERFIHQSESAVRISAFVIPASTYAGRVEAVSEDVLQDLFHRFQDNMPGEGEPYGFGYRYPNRVKIEFLEIPADMLDQHVTVSEEKALEHYQSHQSDYKVADDAESAAAPTADSGPDKIQPYRQVRKQIIDQLQTQEAQQLGLEMIRTAQSIIVNHDRNLPSKNGYRVLDDESVQDWQPMSLTTLAMNLQERHGLLPKVEGYEDRWLNAAELSALPGIGQSTLMGKLPAPFALYVLSARGLTPPEESLATDNLAVLRLQTNIVSEPLVASGNFYLFRLIEIQAAHSPTSLEEVRPQVQRNAKQRQAYELLVSDRQRWIDRARREEFEDVATELGWPVLNPSEFVQRPMDYFGREQIPEVQGIGRDSKFVDRVFEMAQIVAEAGGVESASPGQRIDAIGLARTKRLAIVRIDKFVPITKSRFASAAVNPAVQQDLARTLNPLTEDPFSPEALEQRVGFVEETPDETDLDAESTASAAN